MSVRDHSLPGNHPPSSSSAPTGTPAHLNPILKNSSSSLPGPMTFTAAQRARMAANLSSPGSAPPALDPGVDYASKRSNSFSQGAPEDYVQMQRPTRAVSAPTAQSIDLDFSNLTSSPPGSQGNPPMGSRPRLGANGPTTTTVMYPSMPPMGTMGNMPLPQKAIKVTIPPVPTSLPILSPSSVTSPTSPGSPLTDGSTPTSATSSTSTDLVVLDQKTGKKRRRLTSEETRVLTTEFEKNPKPNAKLRNKLSMEIPGMTARAVQIWFQNRRQKWKMTKPKGKKDHHHQNEDGANPASTLSPSSSTSSLSNAASTSSATATPSPATLVGRHDGKRETKRPALGTGIRRYASDGAIERGKKEDDNALLSWNPDNFWLQLGAGGGTQSPVVATHHDEPDGTGVRKKSVSAPDFKAVQRDFNVPGMENLSLEPSGLEPLYSYAANLVSGRPIVIGGEEIHPAYGTSVPLPVPTYLDQAWQPPALSSENTSGNRQSGELYPSLGVNMQMYYRGTEEDPTHGLRKTRSAPNIHAFVNGSHTHSLSITPPPEDLFWGSDLDSEFSDVLGRVSEDFSDIDGGRPSYEGLPYE